MVKRIVLTIVQFFVFIGLLAVGGNWDVINLQSEMRQMQAGNLHPSVMIPTVKYQISATHMLISNGLIFAGILFVLILLIQAIRRKLHPWAALTTLAFLLAIALGFAMKLGLPPVS